MDTQFGRRIYLPIIVLFTLAAVFALRQPVQAQGGDHPAAQASLVDTTPTVIKATLDNEGYSHWRLNLDPTCRFTDHNYTLDVQEDPSNLSDILLTAETFDVDYRDPKKCEGGPEVDLVTFNKSPVGFLTGANGSWSVNPWGLSPQQVVRGLNVFHIYTDSTKTGCWCVGVGSIDLRARVGFVITELSPKAGEQYRDFHAGKLGLTATFSSALDPATVNSKTFLLAYRDVRGNFKEVPGEFSFPAPNQFSFRPLADLKDGVRYYLTVFGGGNGVKGAGGSKLDATRTLEFWTVPDLGLSDSFDYGDGRGSRCAPSASPCPGVEIAVFQVARNATLVPGKPAVARLYVRWRRHPDVYPDDQVKQMNVKADLKLGFGFNYSGTHVVRRPDQYANAEIASAANTINIYHTPRYANEYQVTIEPLGGVTPIVFAAEKALDMAPRAFGFTFDHYYLKGGDWKDGVPEATQTTWNGLVRVGAQLVTDMFPFVETTVNERGNLVVDYTVLPTNTTDATCGPVRQVMCTLANGVKRKRSEINCIQSRIQSLAGRTPLVSVTVPRNVCPTAAGVQTGSSLYLMDITHTTPVVVPHEVGHRWGISKANEPTPSHRGNPDGIEGFQVRTQGNRSRTENIAKPLSLMQPALAPPEGLQWIHNGDYATLLNGLVAAHAQAAAGSYLIVQGSVDPGGATAQLEAVFQQQTQSETTAETGTCSAVLLDSAHQILVSVPFTPVTEAVPELDPTLTATAVAASDDDPALFNVSLPWNEAARSLQIACGGKTLLTEPRSIAAPVVDFSGLTDGASLSGQVQIAWTGNDADSGTLAYQLQFSDGSGATWTPLTPVGVDAEHLVDTTLLPSGSGRGLRVLVTDGFNTAYATRNVTIANPLTVLSQAPEPDAEGVPVNSVVQVLFNTPIDAQTLSAQSVKLLTPWGASIDASLRLSSDERQLTLQPQAPLAANTGYTVRINDGLKDISGAVLASGGFATSFHTAPDTEAPYVTVVYPPNGATSVSRQTLVQVTPNEKLKDGAANQTTFQIRDAAGKAMNGTVYNSIPGSNVFYFRPAVAFAANATYTATLAAQVSDSAGNPLGSTYAWHFTTGPDVGPEAAILGNHAEEAVDENGDGLYDRLTLFVDVQSSGSFFNLNGRLIDKNGDLIQWKQADFDKGLNGGLLAGVQRVALSFDADVIRAHNVDGPYTLDALFFYGESLIPLPWAPEGDLRYKAYQTLPYAVGQFGGVLSFKPLPDRLLEWNTTSENAWNLHDYTIDLVRPVSEVKYTIIGNTDPRVGVSIDADANIDIHPEPNVEAESDVTVKGCDQAGNCAQGAFTVQVQKPHAALLVASPAVRVPANGTRAIDVVIQDQWQRVFTGGEVTLTIGSQRQLGTVQPTSLMTSSGRATATYRAGDLLGYDVVTIYAKGGLLAKIRVDITLPLELYLPAMRGH